MKISPGQFRLLSSTLVGTLVLLAQSPAGAQVVRQLTDMKSGLPPGIGVMDDAGTVVFSNAGTNQFGGNPGFSIQIVKFDPSTAVGSVVTSFSRGVSELATALSISDDGQWLAFISSGNLTGNNYDESPELFVMKQDGTLLAQLTNDPAPNAGLVKVLAMAGTQTSPTGKIVFISNSNPLGSNSDHHDQVFIINRDGTGLAQLTSSSGGDIVSLAISDDGQRIAFISEANLTGGNADGNYEVFRVQADGSGLTQITSATTGYCNSVAIAGGGTKIVFDSTENLTGHNPTNKQEIFVVNWGSSTITQLTNSVGPLGVPAKSTEPSITHDGQFVFFASNQAKGPINTDFNYEVWKVKTDGTGLTALTDTTWAFGAVYYYPVIVSGNGSRVTYLATGGNINGGNPDNGAELYTVAGTGGTIKQLSNTPIDYAINPDITPDGSLVVFTSRDNEFGTNADGQEEIFRIQSDGTGLAQVTNFPSGGNTSNPSIAADDSTIVFTTGNNPFRHELRLHGRSLQDPGRRHRAYAAHVRQQRFLLPQDLSQRHRRGVLLLL